MEDFASILIEWYEINKRDLPWRNTKDPYKIWISEIILQQTRVVQGYDYFMRFIRRFPDLKTLAEATEDEVLKYWQGLGYYSRARNLHAAAKSMEGTFPTDYRQVRALKGVGNYTAAAICSIAFGQPYAVVDGNVYRVLSRYFAIETPIDTTEGKKEFAVLAQELLDKQRPGLYNQAIMDFGAIQCTPASPNCLLCPLSDSCLSLSKGMVDKLPVKQNKTKVRNRYFNYIYVRMGAHTFLNKRSANDIWKGLYELPLIETERPLNGCEELLQHPVFISFLEGQMAVRDIRLVKKGVKHVLSHQIIYADFYEIVLPEDSAAFCSFIKVKEEDLDAYAVPKLIHAFLESLKREG